MVTLLVNNAFAYCFKESRLKTTGSWDVEHKKYCGQISTIMRALTCRGGDLISHFDENDESQTEINNTSVKLILVDNHDVAAKNGKVKVIYQ